MQPKVSVIIPIYNVAPYVREALDSVVNQTYKELEIILIDDGSTDGSGAICDEYKSDPRITVIHQTNRGLSGARNVGLNVATGDFIAFLDPDDAYHPEFCQRMLDTILREKCDVVECSVMNYNLTLDSRGWLTSAAQEGLYDRVQSLRGLMDIKFSNSVCNKLYRKELWNEIRFPEGQSYEDSEVTSSIFSLIDRLYYLKQPLYFRRFRPDSITQTFSHKNAGDRMLSCEHIITFVENHRDVFDETYLNRAREKRMYGALKFYAKGVMDVNKLRESSENVDPKKCGFRGRAIYHIIHWCPWMLKILYPIYELTRRWTWKVVWG